MMIEKRLRIIPQVIIPQVVIPQREEEYFVVGDEEFENESEAQACVRAIKVSDAFTEFANDVTHWPTGDAYYGSHGVKKVAPTSASLQQWLSRNEYSIMTFYSKLGDEE